MGRKKRKQTTKLEAERLHAKQRFLERYGINFNRHMRRDFEILIKTKQTHLIKKQSNRTSIHDVIYGGEVYRVVWDKKRQTVITVLPDEKSMKRVQELKESMTLG